MSRISRPLIAFALAAFSLTGASATRAANDLLADRQVLPGLPADPVSGSTVTASLEPGEINESGTPAGAGEKSVWYEWTPGEDGVVYFQMDFAEIYPYFSGPRRGLAVYSLADAGAPAAMGNLVPEGGTILRAPFNDPEGGVRVRVAAGRKLILRAWTAPAASGGSTAGEPFTLTVSFTASTAPREEGDLPATALPLKTDRSGLAFYADLFPDGRNHSTSEAADHLIGGKRYPAGTAQWFRWLAPASMAGTPARFSVPGHSHFQATVLVATRAPQGTALDLVAAPADTVTFIPEAGREYLLRVGMPALPEDSSNVLTLTGAAMEPGDEPAQARPITPGVPLVLNLAGASPTFTSSGENPDHWMDVWLDAGSSLSGRYLFKMDRSFETTVYLADTSGNLLDVVTETGYAGYPQFLAEPGNRYLVRVQCPSFPGSYVFRASLEPLTVPAPANDRRENAELLPSAGPVVITGNPAGATAEISDPRTYRYSDPAVTLWYALDLPAGGPPWYVEAPGARDVALFRDMNGSVASLKGRIMTPDGGRVLIMVDAEASRRFQLMAGPAQAEGDTVDAAVPLTAGVTRVLYSGTITPDSPVPGSTSTAPTQWLSWKATQSGPVVFTLAGSTSEFLNTRVFTAGMVPVETTMWIGRESVSNQDITGETLSFQATAGETYLVGLTGQATGITRARIQPGGWESPYDLWLECFPAEADRPGLKDPLGDADGDGVANLIEMAIGTDPFLPQYGQFPFEAIYPGDVVEFQEKPWALRGAEGSRPFTLVLESTSNLVDWTPAPHLVYDNISTGIYHLWYPPTPAEEGAPARYHRLR